MRTSWACMDSCWKRGKMGMSGKKRGGGVGSEGGREVECGREGEWVVRSVEWCLLPRT